MHDYEEDDYLKHYGILRKSGRYPWGSGENPHQRSITFLQAINEMRRQGMTEAQVAKAFGMSTTELRATNAIAINQKRAADVAMAQRLKEKGLSNTAIGERMAINESSVRSLLDPSRQDRAEVLMQTSALLKQQVAEKGYLDVGLGTEAHMGIPKQKLDTALAVLKDEGYEVRYIQVEQVGMPGKYTNIKVLTAPDIPYSELYKNRDQIQTIQGYTDDYGRTYKLIETPTSINSKRIQVRYGPEGGSDMDGVMELRPGVDDISLQGKSYAQVRIAVDGTHYLKGMAIYNDNLPDGVDIRFNTNKNPSSNKLDAMKPLGADEENPFGSTVRQRTYIGKDGKEHLSAINIVGSKEGAGEEGGWDTWSRTLASQVLSKQSTQLAQQQLDLAYQKKKAQFDEIKSLTNPAVRKKLLDSFADSADSAAVDLKAAALPRQRVAVILPSNKLKDTEVYAPNFNHGEKVVLIRYPHGGTFEIPELTVNNSPKFRKEFGQPQDGIFINSKVAQRLSGADFDGDTVVVIPNNTKQIKTTAPLKSLQGFDPITAYPAYEGMKRMTPTGKQKAMGDVSNLITDMTIKGATAGEIARAVKHSMVVIDAEKHNLNYKQSAIDNGISDLKKKYQIKDDGKAGGASTLISRASSQQRVPDRKLRRYADGGPVDPKTGEKVYEYTGETYVDKKGKTVQRTISSTKMAEAKDARTLMSKEKTSMERIYATHANKLKALGNQARLESLKTPPAEYSPSARKAYPEEVASLKSKLTQAQKNKPMERQAQNIARAEVTAKRKSNPNMTGEDIKKASNQALTKARLKTSSEKKKITITPKEWAAIQAGAVSDSMLKQLLKVADDKNVKELATPRESKPPSAAKIARAKAMAARGYTQAEIAAQLGLSASQVNGLING